jgi:predicted Zn-dependent protease
MRDYFFALADDLATRTLGGEVALLWLSGEASEFVRFNRTRIQQAMHVRQGVLTVTLIAGRKRVGSTVTLTFERDTDRRALDGLMAGMRGDLALAPEDPYLRYATELRSSESVAPSTLPDTGHVVDCALREADGRDMVGFYASGPVVRGFANTLGQRNWHESAWFDFNWSLYLRADKAVKAGYVGTAWQDDEFARRMRTASERVALLDRPPRHVAPGRYRAFFMPAAMTEFLGALAWGGFSEKGRRSRQSTLGRLYEGAATLSPLVTLGETTAGSVAPAFQEDGYMRPDRLVFVDRGRPADTLVSPRTAAEYAIESTGANGAEMPESLDLAPGTLATEAALRELGTGLFVSNLWYLNYSDRQACRLTGMTRFASFWVENGEIVAPLVPVRFDDTVYRMFGEGLVGLTREVDTLPDGDTYGGRSTRFMATPGALVNDFAVVL